MDAREVSWEQLDKKKFYFLGTGIFSAVTTCLYPLTVIKTRHIAGPVHLSGLKGVQYTVTDVWRNEGARGFYKGFGTVCLGALPARTVYMSALELSKHEYRRLANHTGLSDTASSGVVNLLAGGTASLCSQTIFVPIDVISQRLMVLNERSPGNISERMNGLSMARSIVRQEGIRGLWKGFFTSVATYVPNSAIWWGCYGLYKRVLWMQLDWARDELPVFDSLTSSRYLAMSDSTVERKTAAAPVPLERQSEECNSTDIIAVQTTAALLSGVTSAFFTTPLDVVKTRTQLAIAEKGKKRVTATMICRQIFQEQGISGFMRGLVPRAANVALWGTSMVSAYEFLKRVSLS